MSIKTEYYVHNVPIKNIVFNPDNPFKNMEDGSFVRLLNSIRKVGIIEPIIVRVKNCKYEIISGQRRVRAAEILGMETVPAIVYEVDDYEAVILTTDSNITVSEVRE